MEVSLTIFDLDGVIVDTAKYHYLAWSRLAEELQIEFTKTDNERLKGISRMHSLEIILEIGGQTKSKAEKEALAAKKNAWYLQYINAMTEAEILPGVLDFLQEIQANNIKIALGSASKNAVTILERLQLKEFFDVIIDGNAITKGKPDPEVFSLATRKLNILPEQTIVFEDAQAGIQAALNGGMTAIGVGSAHLLSAAHLVIPGFAKLNWEQFLTLLNRNL